MTGLGHSILAHLRITVVDRLISSTVWVSESTISTSPTCTAWNSPRHAEAMQGVLAINHNNLEGAKCCHAG